MGGTSSNTGLRPSRRPGGGTNRGSRSGRSRSFMFAPRPAECLGTAIEIPPVRTRSLLRTRSPRRRRDPNPRCRGGDQSAAGERAGRPCPPGLGRTELRRGSGGAWHSDRDRSLARVSGPFTARGCLCRTDFHPDSCGGSFAMTEKPDLARLLPDDAALSARRRALEAELGRPRRRLRRAPHRRLAVALAALVALGGAPPGRPVSSPPVRSPSRPGSPVTAKPGCTGRASRLPASARPPTRSPSAGSTGAKAWSTQRCDDSATKERSTTRVGAIRPTSWSTPVGSASVLVPGFPAPEMALVAEEASSVRAPGPAVLSPYIDSQLSWAETVAVSGCGLSSHPGSLGLSGAIGRAVGCQGSARVGRA